MGIKEDVKWLLDDFDRRLTIMVICEDDAAEKALMKRRMIVMQLIEMAGIEIIPK